MTNYGELPVSQLVEMINTEYEVIVDADRSNLQRAISIGEKLIGLKPRVAEHGKWQQWLKEHCPMISIETANLYMRLAGNREKLEKAADEKSVSLTDLSITEARQLLAKPKSPTNKTTKPTKAVKAALEPAMDPEPASLPPDEVIQELEAAELFDILMVVYERDDLIDLATRLAEFLKMTLVPTTDEAAEDVPADADAAVAASAGSVSAAPAGGMRRV
jgi:Protein of unknown function (DUF3102)